MTEENKNAQKKYTNIGIGFTIVGLAFLIVGDYFVLDFGWIAIGLILLITGLICFYNKLEKIDLIQKKRTNIGIGFTIVGLAFLILGDYFMLNFGLIAFGFILLIKGLILCFYHKLEKVNPSQKNQIITIEQILGFIGIISFFVGGFISDKDIWTRLYRGIFFLLLPIIGYIKFSKKTQNYILNKEIRNIIFVLCFFDILLVWTGRGGVFSLFLLPTLGLIRLFEELGKENKEEKQTKNKLTTILIRFGITILISFILFLIQFFISTLISPE